MKVIFQGRRIDVPDPPSPVVAPAIVTSKLTAAVKEPANDPRVFVELMRLLVSAVDDGKLTATDARNELAAALELAP